jgi:hypothetical protein
VEAAAGRADVDALFGRAAPELWLATVRALVVLALVEAFRVARRFADGAR